MKWWRQISNRFLIVKRGMDKNKLSIKINCPLEKVFEFTTTPPNSSLWIPGVVGEETSEWPIKVGTVYRLTDNLGNISNVAVNRLEKNKLVEWVSENKNYYCRYVFKKVADQVSILEYFEWVTNGEIENPFDQKVLERLKTVLEK